MSARAPITIGSASGLTPSPGATMQKNAYGLDVLQRPFSCPRSLVSSKVPAKGSVDIFYTNLRATGNYSVSEGEGLQCTITVEYKGLLNNIIPDALVSYGSTMKCVTFQREAGGETRTYTVAYTSDVLEIKYIAQNSFFVPPIHISTFGYRFISSVYEVVDSGDSNRIGKTFSGNPASPSILPVSEVGSRNPVPGTPFYECSQTQYYNIS